MKRVLGWLNSVPWLFANKHFKNTQTMKKFIQIIILTLTMMLCVILELLQKLVIWDSTPIDNIRYTFKDYKEHCKPLAKKIYWPSVFGYVAGFFGGMVVYFYVKDNMTKQFLSGFACVLTFSWALLLDTRPTYEVMGNSKWLKYILFLLFVIIVLFSSCSVGQCPTTNKQYFMRGVPKSKSLYKGYGRVKYTVPYKYRKNVVNYGKLKRY